MNRLDFFFAPFADLLCDLCGEKLFSALYAF